MPLDVLLKILPSVGEFCAAGDTKRTGPTWSKEYF